MKWNKFTLKTRSEVEDIVISTLADVGIEGVEIQDKQPLTESDKQQMFVDIMPDIPDDDGIAYLNFYLDVDEDKEKVLADVRAALAEMQEFLDLGECTITESETEDKDWINNWKQYFKQFYVDDILIIPSWEEVKPEDRDKMIIHIDPGTAFGTGMHETTQLCIRQLKKYVTKDTELLDVGTGSGILSIIALKLGARHAVGTDLDPCAVPAVEENKEVNGIPVEAFNMMIGNIIDDKEVQDRVGYEKYDIVTANILADVLVPLTPVIVHQMKPGAVYITSGILDVKEDVVKEAVVAAGLEVVEVTHQGEWVSVTARKPM
jgi:ribosomal protein L11 methyltransferase